MNDILGFMIIRNELCDGLVCDWVLVNDGFEFEDGVVESSLVILRWL